MQLRKVSETTTKINFEYDKVPGCEGYLYYKDGVRVSRTFDPDDTTVSFGLPFSKVKVEAVDFHTLDSAIWSTTAPPTSGDVLAWRPPGFQGGDPLNPTNYPGYQVMHLTAANRDISTAIDSGKDCLIIQDQVAPSARIMGWRNVVWIRGKLDQLGPNDNGLNVTALSGTLHVEGVDIGGAGIRDAVGLMTGHVAGKPGATVRFQNCRLRAGTYGNYHGDCIQIWGDPGVGSGYVGGLGQLQIDRLTCVTDLQCLFLRNDVTGQALEGGDIRRVNMEGSGGYFFFKGVRTDAHGHTSVVQLTDVWMNNTDKWGSWAHMVAPDDNGSFIPDGPPADSSRAAKVGSDVIGEFVYWPSVADVKGVIRIGSPPGGDFVPASKVGMGYVPIGYA